MARLSADQLRARLRHYTPTKAQITRSSGEDWTIVGMVGALIAGGMMLAMALGECQNDRQKGIAARKVLVAEKPLAYSTAPDGATIITHTHKGEAPKIIARVNYKDGCPELQIDGAAYQKMLAQDRTGRDRLQGLAQQFKDAAGCRPIVKRSSGLDLGISFGKDGPQIGPVITF